MRSAAAAAQWELIGDGRLSARVVLGQLRSTTVDLLQATEVSRDEAVAALATETVDKRRTATAESVSDMTFWAR